MEQTRRENWLPGEPSVHLEMTIAAQRLAQKRAKPERP